MDQLASSGQIFGAIKCNVKYTQSFSPLLGINYWVFRRPKWWNPSTDCSIFHFQRKLLHNWGYYKTCMRIKPWAMMWTGGVTSGEVPSSPQGKPIRVWLVMHKYIEVFIGLGTQVVKINTRFSYGSYSKTGWVQGTFLDGNQCFCLLTTVFYALTIQKKLWNIFFCDVPLLKLAWGL